MRLEDVEPAKLDLTLSEEDKAMWECFKRYTLEPGRERLRDVIQAVIDAEKGGDAR